MAVQTDTTSEEIKVIESQVTETSEQETTEALETSTAEEREEIVGSPITEAGTEAEIATGEDENGGFVSEPVYLVCIGILLFLVVFFAFKLRKKKREELVTVEPFEGVTEHPEPEIAPEPEENMVPTDATLGIRVAKLHGVGMRQMQQDSFGISDNLSNAENASQKGILAIVADGMGGLSEGEKMSQLVVVTMLSSFDRSESVPSANSLLVGLVREANEAVNRELGRNNIGKSGSTVVAVYLKDKKLSFVSVGDSHIYVWRKGEIFQINHDHNYAAQLDEKMMRGEISMEEAALDPQRAALTSYIGIGELELIDYNDIPIQLEEGDRVLLMSDGVYGTIPDSEIAGYMNNTLSCAASFLEKAIIAAGKRNQDNYTCLLIEVKGAHE